MRCVCGHLPDHHASRLLPKRWCMLCRCVEFREKPAKPKPPPKPPKRIERIIEKIVKVPEPRPGLCPRRSRTCQERYVRLQNAEREAREAENETSKALDLLAALANLTEISKARRNRVKKFLKEHGR